jgi:hypothetical protein
MLVAVVIPEQRVVPAPAETNHSEPFSHLCFEAAQSLPKALVALLHAPQFERVVELIDDGDFDPLFPDVIQSPSCGQEMVDLHDFLELQLCRRNHEEFRAFSIHRSHCSHVRGAKSIRSTSKYCRLPIRQARQQSGKNRSVSGSC